jgi:hypothetical protein
MFYIYWHVACNIIQNIYRKHRVINCLCLNILYSNCQQCRCSCFYILGLKPILFLLNVNLFKSNLPFCIHLYYIVLLKSFFWRISKSFWWLHLIWILDGVDFVLISFKYICSNSVVYWAARSKWKDFEIRQKKDFNKKFRRQKDKRLPRSEMARRQQYHMVKIYRLRQIWRHPTMTLVQLIAPCNLFELRCLLSSQVKVRANYHVTFSSTKEERIRIVIYYILENNLI